MKRKEKMKTLQGKTAIVTGGAKGIGEAVVRRLAADGAFVIIADRDADAGKKLARELTEKQALFAECDVRREEDILRVIETAEQIAGQIDIIVNDAALQLNKPLLETSAEEFDNVMNTNVRSAFLFLREGALIPTQPLRQFIDAKAIRHIDWIVYPGKQESSFTLYLDDGDTIAHRSGQYGAVTLRCVPGEGFFWSGISGKAPEYVASLTHNFILPNGERLNPEPLKTGTPFHSAAAL